MNTTLWEIEHPQEPARNGLVERWRTGPSTAKWIMAMDLGCVLPMLAFVTFVPLSLRLGAAHFMGNVEHIGGYAWIPATIYVADQLRLIAQGKF